MGDPRIEEDSEMTRLVYYMATLSLSLALVPIGSSAMANCQVPSDPQVESVAVLISTESAVLGKPVSMHVGPDGTLYVVDQLNGQVHRISASGSRLGSIGRKGSGPGEFQSPIVVEAGANTFHVVDQGNGRVQEFNSNGDYLSTRPVPPFAARRICDLGPAGKLAVTTLGFDSALAAVYDQQGERLSRMGTPPEEMPSQINMGAMRQRIARGEIPGFFRNTAFPHYGPVGDLWLNLITDGAIQRYAEDGELLLEYKLDEPEMDGIKEAFVEQHSDPSFRGLLALRYAADLYSTGQELWVLLNRGDDEGTVIVRLSMDGRKLGRIVIPEVKGAKQLAVDAERSRVFLALPSTAAVVAIQFGRESTR
jgi:hypothetical protein